MKYQLNSTTVYSRVNCCPYSFQDRKTDRRTDKDMIEFFRLNRDDGRWRGLVALTCTTRVDDHQHEVRSRHSVNAEWSME